MMVVGANEEEGYSPHGGLETEREGWRWNRKKYTKARCPLLCFNQAPNIIAAS